MLNKEAGQAAMRENPVGFLRAFADYLEAHPDIIAGVHEFHYVGFNAFTYGKEEFTRLVRQAGAGEKVIDAADDYAPRARFYPNLGEFTGAFCISIPKDSVCQRVQVGTKLVPAEPERIEVKEIVHTAVPEHEEPIYEWDCSGSWTERDEEEEPVAVEVKDDIPF